MFSVPRVAGFMKKGHYSNRIARTAPVYLTASLQYICSEIVEVAGMNAEQHNKSVITPKHIMRAIRKDPELFELIHGYESKDDSTKDLSIIEEVNSEEVEPDIANTDSPVEFHCRVRNIEGNIEAYLKKIKEEAMKDHP